MFDFDWYYGVIYLQRCSKLLSHQQIVECDRLVLVLPEKLTINLFSIILSVSFSFGNLFIVSAFNEVEVEGFVILQQVNVLLRKISPYYLRYLRENLQLKYLVKHVFPWLLFLLCDAGSPSIFLLFILILSFLSFIVPVAKLDIFKSYFIDSCQKILKKHVHQVRLNLVLPHTMVTFGIFFDFFLSFAVIRSIVLVIFISLIFVIFIIGF